MPNPPAPRALFSQLDEETWLWANTEGHHVRPGFASYLPSLPSEAIQSRASAVVGDECVRLAFPEWRLVMQLYRQHRGPTTEQSAVLDFGCGWGRFTRFFLRDFEPINIHGIDPDEVSIRAAQEIDPWCTFRRSCPTPPSYFDDQRFDLVFAHSVFSHLPEALHLAWLEELRRILRPGGLFVATTLPRQFLEECTRQEGAADLDSKPTWLRNAVRGFAPARRTLTNYDAGHFCYTAEGEPNPQYGYACIPERYARERWSEWLHVLDYIADPALSPQNIIVAQCPQ